MLDASRFEAMSVREHLQQRGFLPDHVIRFYYRPFDVRWLYWEPQTKLLDEKRADYFPHVGAGNLWLSAAPMNRKGYSPPVISSVMCSRHMIERGATLFPLYLATEPRATDLFSDPVKQINKPNLSSFAALYSDLLDIDAATLFHHCLAIMHAPAYGAENAGALRQDWPRLPLPSSAKSKNKDVVVASARLGRKVAALLNVEREAEGVTVGEVPPMLRYLARPVHQTGRPLNPVEGDFDVTVRWGYINRKGAIMPGKGRAIERDYTEQEREALPEAIRTLLGETTFDVFLNEEVCWKNVPAQVWHYRLGGYLVLKKWLSYRAKAVLARGLTTDEVRHVMQTARRIASLLLLTPQLDSNYEAVKQATGVRSEAEAVWALVD